MASSGFQPQPSQYVGDEIYETWDASENILPTQNVPLPEDCGSEYEDAGDVSFFIDPVDIETRIDDTLSQASYADAYDDSILYTLEGEGEASKCSMPPTQPVESGSDVASIDSFASVSRKRKATDEPEGMAPKTSSNLRPLKLLKPTHAAPFKPSQVHIIASQIALQQCIDRRKMPYGVQYEIWRLISNGLSPEDIKMEQLDELAKIPTNKLGAPRTASLLCSPENDQEHARIYAKEISAKSPWEELDWEESALAQNHYAALGFSDPENPNHYGGKIIFGGKVNKLLTGEGTYELKVKLDRAELGPSSRFLRRFGSRRFLRLKLSRDALASSNLIGFFLQPFILGTSVFRSFYAKEDNVFLYCTNEVWDGKVVATANTSDNLRMSLLEFLEWHNPLHANASQSMAKWAARFALGLSNSVPGCVLKPEHILTIPDVESPAGSDMTDGAGSMNHAALQLITQSIGWSRCPTAIQCRAGGGSLDAKAGDAKGLLILDHANHSPEPKISLRPSQVKVKHPPHTGPNNIHLVDRAFLVVDVLRASHAHTPSRLSSETIINLAENGVPAEAFIKLLRGGLAALRDPLLRWEGPDAMFNLWCAVAESGGVMSARRAREKLGEARVMGYLEADQVIELDDEENLQQAQQRSTAWWGDPISGCPSQLDETAMYLLEAGFRPQLLPVLREKLECVIKPLIKRYIQNYRIDVPMSATAFIIPDPFEILQPGEVFFKCSTSNLKTPDGIDIDIILGDVLVTRHPCKLPTDVQKWKAVNYPQLLHLTDVVILPITGSRRAADYLAGGDYDGDKALIIWQPELVQPFQNDDLCYANEPDEVKAAFIQENKQVCQFLDETVGKDKSEILLGLQQFLLGALEQQSLVGQYSNYHQNSIYMNGYRHKETIRLAYMFCKILDSAKSGQRVTHQQLRKDTKEFNHRSAKWSEKEDQLLWHQHNNEAYLTRNKKLNLGRFIMDILYDLAKVEGDAALKQTEEAFNNYRHLNTLDPDLVAPWTQAKALADQMAHQKYKQRWDDLQTIKAHVASVYQEHRQKMADAASSHQLRKRNSKKKNGPVDSGAGFTEMPIELRQDIIRGLSRRFAESPKLQDLPSFAAPGVHQEPRDVTLLKASYAYIHDWNENNGRRGWTRFPWDVAMRSLCDIKAAAIGGHKTVSGDFHSRMYIKKYSC